jgi:predicted RNA binding protein YcfA (HicA-like mRNA interferase family)
MKITIDDEVILKEGFTIQEFFTCLALAESDDMSVKQMLRQLDKKGWVFTDENGNVKPYQNIRDKIRDVLLHSETSIPYRTKLKMLADRLRPLYPTGMKPETNSMWRGGRGGVAKRLEIFYKEFNEDNSYSEDDIVEATSQYISSFNGNYRFMRTLENFIYKDGDSDLAKALDNLGDMSANVFDNAEFI